MGVSGITRRRHRTYSIREGEGRKVVDFTKLLLISLIDLQFAMVFIVWQNMQVCNEPTNQRATSGVISPSSCLRVAIMQFMIFVHLCTRRR